MKGVDRIFEHAGSGSYLLDGIIEASQGFKKREAQRPVIVAITTEGPEFSYRAYEQVSSRCATSAPRCTSSCSGRRRATSTKTPATAHRARRGHRADTGGRRDIAARRIGAAGRAETARRRS